MENKPQIEDNRGKYLQEQLNQNKVATDVVKQEMTNTKAMYTKTNWFISKQYKLPCWRPRSKKSHGKHVLENILIANQEARWEDGIRTNIKAIA